jgi:hypothetical protein
MSAAIGQARPSSPTADPVVPAQRFVIGIAIAAVIRANYAFWIGRLGGRAFALAGRGGHSHPGFAPPGHSYIKLIAARDDPAINGQ